MIQRLTALISIWTSLWVNAGASPNVLIFLVDDLGYGDLGCTGSTLAETPNIDQFSTEGIRFTNAYAPAAHCSPSRAGILTGQYPARLHITSWIGGEKETEYAGLQLPVQEEFLPESAYTMAEYFKSRGYTTVQLGKWHVGADIVPIERHGFDAVIGHAVGASPGATNKWYGPYPSIADLNGPSDEYITDRLTDEAIGFIEANTDAPFFMMLQHYDVHGPLTAPADVVQKYVDQGVPFETGNENATFLAMKEKMDDSFGAITSKLKELDIYDDTIVLFFSDNGGLAYHANNGPLRRGKKWLYEGGVRVPLLMHVPGISATNAICDIPVNGIDFFPTLVELTGGDPAQIGSEIDGESFAPVLEGTGSLEREALFWHSPQLGHSGGIVAPQGGARMGEWKLIHYYGDTQEAELYHLDSDLSEETNMASSNPETVAQMTQMLEQHLDDVDAQRVIDPGEVVTLSPRADIIASVDTARPLNGGTIPDDYADRIGITHYGGRYHLSDKPFLVEGMENIRAMGFRIAKLWLSARSDQMRRGYYFNSEWPDYNSAARLVDVAQHPDVHKVLSMDFETILLEVNTRRGEEWRTAPDYGTEDYYDYLETEFYDLSRYLLETYADQDITFVYHNWAGDWMLQNKGVAGWVEWGVDALAVPADVDQQVAGMIRYFQARQAGVTRARADVTNTLVTVAHAIKVNQIWENIEHSFPDWETTLEIPTNTASYAYPSVLTHVVPQAKPDMVVCAAYETKDDHPVKLWRLIELMRAFTPPSDLYGADNVAIGELGYRDNIPPLSREEVRAYWDHTLGVVFAMDLPHCVFWELYANEAVNDVGDVIPTGDPNYYGTVFSEEDLRGFWFVKPDGTLSAAGKYFTELLPAGDVDVIGRNAPGLWKDDDVWRISNVVEPDCLPDRNDRVNLTSKVNGTVSLESGPILLGTALRVGCYAPSSNDTVSLEVNAPLFVEGLTSIGSHSSGGAGEMILSRPLVCRTESLTVGEVSTGSLTINSGGIYEVAGGNAVIGPQGTVTIRDGVFSVGGDLLMSAGSRLKLYGNSQVLLRATNGIAQYIADGWIAGEGLGGNISAADDGTNTALSVSLRNTAVEDTRMDGSRFVLDMGKNASGMRVLYAPDLFSEFDEEVNSVAVESNLLVIPKTAPQRQGPQGFFRVLGSGG